MTDLIIFTGQSNMQGQSNELIPHPLTEGLYEYRYLTDSLVPLADPVGENITNDLQLGDVVTKETDGELWRERNALGAACYGNTNLVPEFCREYKRVTGHDVVAVHAAKGATVVAQWLEGELCFNALSAKVQKALDKVHPDRIFAVWLQGESDAIISNTEEVYIKQLTEFKNLLKSRFGVEKFGIIRVGRFVNDSRDDVIINAQDKICTLDSDFVMLTREATRLNTLPEYMNPEVAGHYSAKGLEFLGRAAGNALGVLSV